MIKDDIYEIDDPLIDQYTKCFGYWMKCVKPVGPFKTDEGNYWLSLLINGKVRCLSDNLCHRTLDMPEGALGKYLIISNRRT